MAWLQIKLDQRAANRLLQKLDRVQSSSARLKVQRNASMAAGGVYKKQAAVPDSPIQFGFLKKSWTVAKWKVSKKRADYAVLVKPNPKYVRWRKSNATTGNKFENLRVSKELEKAAKDSKVKVKRGRRVRPSKYAHLTENSINSGKNRHWLRRAARRVESRALKAFITKMQSELKSLL